ncbi:GxxExxY protein [Gammaproteobacteria bacterium]|nr:GxxExxY protein [Gammaproteobacteria bacterium]
MKVKKTKLIKTLEKVCLDIYDELGGLNFDEKDFQIALGYELSSLGIEYLRETHIELYYKDIPIKLGAPDFYLNKEKPATIIEIKLGSSLDNSNRQQLKMYLLSIKRNPKSVLKNVKNGVLINFLKNNPQTFVCEDASPKKKQQYKVEIEQFTLDKEDTLKLLGSSSIGEV